MDWTPDKNKPLCPQICEHVCLMIALGEYRAGERLPSVRDTAVSVGVNPNTVQRSFEALERDGIIHSVRGSGWYVSENVDIAKSVLQKQITQKTAEYLDSMKKLGLDIGSVQKIIKEWKV